MDDSTGFPSGNSDTAANASDTAFDSFQPVTQSANVTGTVVDDVTHVPLAGVLVRWLAPGDREGLTEIGRTATDANGSFVVVPASGGTAAEALCRVHHTADSKSVLLVGDEADSGANTSVRVPAGARDVLVRFEGAARAPGTDMWHDASAFLMSNRMLRVSDLTRELASPSLDSPTRSWPLTTRTTSLRSIAEPLTTATNGALLDQEHFLHLPALGQGDVRKALTTFHPDLGTAIGPVSDDKLALMLDLPPDLRLYRDYLRGVWVTAARQMYATSPVSVNAAPDLLERQLQTRFHQDFRTSDMALQPAAKLLVGILKTGLTTATTAGGFGLAPGAVPAQGTQTDQEYLATLVALSGVDVLELKNRYRVAFERPIDAAVSPIDLNVEALLGLLADTWQSPEEPFPADPVIVRGKPLIFTRYIGRAPFFLQFEEWQERQRRFFPQNVYDIRRNLLNFHPFVRDVIKRYKDNPGPGTFPGHFDSADRQKSCEWLLVHVIGNIDRMRGALAAADLLDYNKALDELTGVEEGLKEALKQAKNEWYMHTFDWLDQNGTWNTDRRISLKHRSQKTVKTQADLGAFEAWFDANIGMGHFAIMKGLARARAVSIWWVYYALYVMVPYFRATVLATVADYAGALRQLGELSGYEVGVAEAGDPAGYKPETTPVFPTFLGGKSLPYTTAVGIDAARYTALAPRLGLESHGIMVFAAARAIAPFEQDFFKLAQGEVMLEWADQLYRNDDPSSIRRARELFKGVLFMHGENPSIAPVYQWTFNPLWPFTQENPARVSQVRRAALGFWQITQGLNAYGYREDMVPVLRFKPLKQAADLFATSAKSAQSDFINYMTRFEQARIEGWQAAAMVKKAQASVGIAKEQIEIAKVGVAKAQEQVAQIKAQIAAKQAEIADADSFFGQAKAFFGGMKDAVTGMVPSVEKVMNDEAPASVGSAEQLKTVLGKGFSGSAALKESAASTLGAGAGLAVGFGIFAYAGYTSMSSMADAASRRAGELKALQLGALPAAEAQVRFKERDVTIANYQREIADADLDLAKTLMRFQQDRFLNVDLWNKLSTLANRLMRQYLDLGGRFGWLAERALAYEQVREIDILRLNYYPSATRGVMGPDKLLFDLAQLEANRLQGVRLSVPIKHTISLARDFPIQFGLLKKNGTCLFHTSEPRLTAAYPGVSGCRVRAVTVAAQDGQGPPPRGMLTNLGVSLVYGHSGSPKVLTRFPDALPLSEFRLQDDLFVYGLPNETLLQFEGSGFETDWELRLPLAANPKGLASLSDVLITFDMNASYTRPPAAAPAGPATVDGAFALGASVFDSGGLATLRATSGPARVRFDLRQLLLRPQEQNRKIANLAVILVGTTKKQYQAKLSSSSPSTQASFQITDGYAMSNAGPLLGTNPPLPLNTFVGANADQVFTLDIERAGVADELKAMLDVVFYVEYTATL